MPANPIRAYKEQRGITYRALAKELGCSHNWLRKLGCGSARAISATRAQQFHKRTGGRLDFISIMSWVGSSTATVKRSRRVRAGKRT